MAKFKVQHEGKEIEIELDAVALSEVRENYVPKAHHDSEFAKLRKKMDKLVEPDSLLESDEFKTKAVEKWGLKGGLPAEQVNQLKSTWEKQHLAPLQKQLETLTAEIQTGRKKDLWRQITDAAEAAGIKKVLRTAPANLPNAPAPIVGMLEAYFGRDDERGNWFARNGEQFAFAAKPTNESPYKGVSEFVTEFAKASPDLLETAPPQKGAGLDRTTQLGGVLTPATRVQSPSQNAGPVRVDAADPLSMGRNLEAIVSGKAVFND